jgi:hypothetical protein
MLNNNVWFLRQAKEEIIDASIREKERQEAIIKDEIIRLLKLQVSQRDKAITQLEDLVRLQQQMVVATHRYSEQVINQGSSRDNRERKDFQYFNCCSKGLEERSNTTSSETLVKQQLRRDFFPHQLLCTRVEENTQGKIIELKCIIHDMQMKLKDKNSTIFHLTRSFKIQNENITNLRLENSQLKERNEMYATKFDNRRICMSRWSL